MKKFTLLLVVLALIGTSGVFALEITGTPPQIGGGTSVLKPVVDALNGQIGTAWDDALDQVNDLIGGINSKPEKLIQGFADASVFASQGATQRGYGSPKLFTFTIGPMIGVKIGSGLGDDILGYFSNLPTELQTEGDASLGLNIQAISAQFNLNTSFLVKGLDLGVRFGMFGLDPIDLEGFGTFGFNTLSFGAVANYQILKEKTIVPVLLKWRGISLGTGLIYQHTNISLAMGYDMDPQPIGSVPLPSIGGVPLGSVDAGNITIEPELNFDITTNTFTIPLEVTTAVQLLFLNIHLGVGADLAFGGNDMTLGVGGKITLDDIPLNLPAPLEPTTLTQTPGTGSLKVEAGGNMAPSFFNFKVMTGVGFKLGPVILDIPLTLYPFGGTGANVGITLGVSI